MTLRLLSRLIRFNEDTLGRRNVRPIASLCAEFRLSGQSLAGFSSVSVGAGGAETLFRSAPRPLLPTGAGGHSPRYRRTARHSAMLPPTGHQPLGRLARRPSYNRRSRLTGATNVNPRRRRIETLARLPRASWWRSHAWRGVQPLVGTGVEPVTARFLVWCSASELTTLSNAAFVRTHARNARDRPPQSVGVWCAAGPATSDFASKSWSRRRWESNPLQTVDRPCAAVPQAVAVPSGSSV
jgi:hypothetical protein